MAAEWYYKIAGGDVVPLWPQQFETMAERGAYSVRRRRAPRHARRPAHFPYTLAERTLYV
ncbi:MAG: hypothetical protein GX594_07645 [Pirellulaceae bacterium]|nr:hypothetical protein [Pirellulaceae bacterium]